VESGWLGHDIGAAKAPPPHYRVQLHKYLHTLLGASEESPSSEKKSVRLDIQTGQSRKAGNPRVLVHSFSIYLALYTCVQQNCTVN